MALFTAASFLNQDDYLHSLKQKAAWISTYPLYQYADSALFSSSLGKKCGNMIYLIGKVRLSSDAFQTTCTTMGPSATPDVISIYLWSSNVS